MVNSRPRVILSAAVSLDGKIATKNKDSALSSGKDKIRFHRLRAKVDAILVGINTVKIDDPLLTVRHARGKNPIRIILDSSGRISPKSKIIKTCHAIPTIIVVSKKAPMKNLARLGKHPLKIIISGQNKINTRKLLQILQKQNIKSILLEGGGTLNWEFIHKGLVDELIVTITPYVVGGKDAMTLVEGNGFSTIANSTKLKLQNIIRQQNEIVLHYYI
ncbi:2,5-diamino-6-(ribosylamino)-4(3H)-pyrimidinone 5'-phosphate reductase [Candidatus Nitrosotenuis sp. DW1]|uniref:2,5-diamino-6-(ribosylamino)-4(3H)-pyrimidinone 5'-phosphate reductase n=1 Tax=Candidatus Nitrosotenuis sp. DW1 TaxID=2259672 RepID=UPI0015CBEC7A|nr:2,5-diamino-6-(ribosylamino)-4(3H)-pyrimidinone 5'-phosphate reductase [Candidatus Nitrosotenuis sp. DW1]QLH08236.1 2,5-diamino-6-(ribosylamino)-4(3H)-pyrimidinone 5'-phosphate reductase [Candidatus Nitrosotenuis sp. DW1]